MHQLANPLTHTLTTLLAMFLTACSGGGGGAGPSNSAAVHLPVMLLSNADGGSGLLGQLLGVPFDSTESVVPFFEFQGTPWISSQSSDAGTGYSLAYNSVDGKFYGVLNGTGAYGTGVLIAFDPLTNQVRTLKTLSKVSAPNETVNGVSVPFVQPDEYRMRPVLSPDGKSLMIRASLGGILDRGVLTHINLDASSSNYLKDTVVYSFYDYERNNGGTCVALVSQPSKSTEMVLQGSVIYMGLGGQTYSPNPSATDPSLRTDCNQITRNGTLQNQIPATTFALSPSDTADWSQAWVYSNPANTGRLATTSYSPWDFRMGRLAYWSSTDAAPRWSAYDVAGNGDYGRFYAGVNAVGSALYPYTTECIAPIGWLPTDRTSGNAILCGGGLAGPSNTRFAAGLYSQATAGAQNLVLQAPFDHWGQTKTFIGATSSLLSRRLFVNGGDMEALVSNCYEENIVNCDPVSSIEELNPSLSYARTVLATGDESKTGKFFFGSPAVGGSSNEPIADRYVVWFGAQVKGYSNVINKYDRLTGDTVTVALDPKAGAHPMGKPLNLGNGQIFGWIKNAPPIPLSSGTYKNDGLGGYQGGPSNWPSVHGFYWADLKSRQITRLVSPNIKAVNAWAMEPLRLADGTIWTAYSNNLTTSQRVIGKLNAASGQIDAFKSFAEPATVPAAAFTLASRANVLYTPLWTSATSQAVGCVRADSATDANQSATVASSGAGTSVVLGATDSTADGALYMPIAGATLGSILEIDKGVLDASLCKAAPTVTTIAQNLPDLPATRILALKGGALVYGTSNGKLMLLDPTQPASTRVRLLADVSGTGATSAVKGYLSEVADGVIAAVVMDYQGDRNTGRRLVQFNMATGSQTSRDIRTQLSEFEPYPGVTRVE